MFKRKKLFITMAIMGFGITASATYLFDVGFKAPAVVGTATASSPELGAIVLDTSSNIFYGNSGTPATPVWNAFNGAGSSLPSGSMIAFGGTSAPGGFLLCDGSAVSRTTYAALFVVIGTSYGPGDGSTTFNLPDLRGKFARGTNNGSGNDPDAASRVDCQTGTTTLGDVVGSCQADQFRSHTHAYAAVGTPTGSGPEASGGYNGGVQDLSTAAAGGDETRPINVNVNYIIKI